MRYIGGNVRNMEKPDQPPDMAKARALVWLDLPYVPRERDEEGGSGRDDNIIAAREEMARRHPELSLEPNFVEKIGEAPYYDEYRKILDGIRGLI